MDMHLWWLHCRASQDQFWYYWDSGYKNWADYNTKHHPDTYHKAHCSTHADIWDWVGTWTLPPRQTIDPWVFPSRIFPFYFLPFFNFFHLSYITTSWMLAQGCVDHLRPTTDKPVKMYCYISPPKRYWCTLGQTVIALAHRYCQNTNNVDWELTELP